MIDIENTATRAIQRMRAAYDRALSELNMTSRQFVVLRFFAASTGASQTDATVETGIDRSTMAEIITRLCDRGFLERERSKIDGRANHVFATTAGNKAIARAERIITNEDARLLAGLTEPNQRTLVTLLDRIGTVENGVHSHA